MVWADREGVVGELPNDAAILAGAMMLDHLGHRDAHDSVMFAIEEVLRQGRDLTPDMGGKATTESLGKAIAALI